MARRRFATGTAALTAALLVLLASPAIAGDVAAPMNPVGDWRTRPDGVRQTITFTADGQVSGDAGCNRFVGGYTVKGGTIAIGPLATTLMMCEDSVMAAESSFLTRIQAAVSYSATKRVLKIYAPKDLVRFTRR